MFRAGMMHVLRGEISNSMSGLIISKVLIINSIHKMNPLCPSLGVGAKRHPLRYFLDLQLLENLSSAQRICGAGNRLYLQIASNGNTSPISPKCGFNFIVFAFLTGNSSLNH